MKGKMMDVEKIEKKFRAQYRVANAKAPGSSGFILTDGSIIVITNHMKACELIGCNLGNALEAGLCRYASHPSAGGNVIALEYTTLTMEQKDSVRKILKADDYFKVITKKTTIDNNRPIRSLNF